jgi:hypothetical protein
VDNQDKKRRGGAWNKTQTTVTTPKMGQVTGFATGKLQKYLQQNFIILELS